MRSKRCWALLPDGTRCPLDSLHGGHFCEDHPLGYQPDPSLIFLAPVAEMPNDIVQYLRAVAPNLVFPEPPPPASEPPPASAPAELAASPTQATDAPADAAGSTIPVAPGESVPDEPMPTLSVSPPEEHQWHQHHSMGSPGPVPDAAARQPELPHHDRRAGPNADSLDWLLGLLKEVMIGVKESDSPPLQKANAVARLGNLYLKADAAAELKRENAWLRQRVAELEHHAAVETPKSGQRAGANHSSDEGMRFHAANASAASGGTTATYSPTPASATATGAGKQKQSPPRHRPGGSGGGRRR